MMVLTLLRVTRNFWNYIFHDEMNKGGYVIIEDISYNPVSGPIFSSVPEELQDDAYVCDFGGYDDRLIIIPT